MQLRTSRKADEDIIAIYLYGVREFGVHQAERYHSDLMATLRLLSEQPMIARERHEFRPIVRIHAHQAHLIVYQVRQDDVLILRVLNGRQDWKELLS
ncbi:type II toxin-antitoxin system RelE/ParE family toxin [Fodinicurvata sediminis]|uniref:type II toxin-antitoxin system RelE/ParE family toxin n=1 Tax=Fodinicurvata sediminis TaxID=1121832 RepID=UPI0003B6981C|nr:type II toxin-antitoxin system RelE/ParE family toxin [Fodinicurvata sediminis]